jgi:hypothetical protein
LDGYGVETMFGKKHEREDREDIGLRLLKLLLYRLYSMSYVIPLKWYEMLIAVIMGVLTGLGIGGVIYSLMVR